MFRPPRDRERRRDPDECSWRPPDNNNPGRMDRGVNPEGMLRCITPADWEHENKIIFKL